MKVGIIAAAVTGSCTLLYLLFRLRFPKQKDKSTFTSNIMGKNESEPLNLSDCNEKEDVLSKFEIDNIVNKVDEVSISGDIIEKVDTPIVASLNCSNDLPIQCVEASKVEQSIKSSVDLDLSSESNTVESKLVENKPTEKISNCSDVGSSDFLNCNGIASLEVRHSIEMVEKEECVSPSDSNEVNCSDNSNSTKSIFIDTSSNISISQLSKDKENINGNLAVLDESKIIKEDIAVLDKNHPSKIDQGKLYTKPSFKNDISTSKSKRLKKREKKNAQKESKLESDLTSQLKAASITSSSSRSPSVSECNSVPEVNGNVWENSKSIADAATTSDWERETSPEQENIIDSQSLVSQASLDSGQGSIEVEPETIFSNSSVPQSSNSTSTDHYIFYQFEIPQLYVGRLIGQKGSFINKVKSTTGTSVVVLDHPNHRLKMCSVEGKKSEVSHALELIRLRFPLDEYHDVTLEQINSPSISPDHQPQINRSVLQVELPAGVVVEVQVSAVVSGGELWLQQPLHPSFSALTRLHHCINLNYGDGSSAPGIPTPVQVNTVCVCRFGPHWLRCQVVDSDDTSCIVTLLDVGGTLRLPSNFLKQIRVDYMSLPFQASQCFLHGIKPVNGTSWDEAARAALEDLTKNTILQATIAAYSQEGIPFVNLYQRSFNRYVFINEKLVEMGHAKWM